MDQETKKLAARCGITFEDAARIVRQSNADFTTQITNDDQGYCPRARFKERLAQPQADALVYPR